MVQSSTQRYTLNLGLPLFLCWSSEPGRTTKEFALMWMCSTFWGFQPCFSHPFSDEGWDLGRDRALVAPADFTPLLGITPSSVTFSCFQIFMGRPCFLLLACQEPLATQKTWTEMVWNAVHLLSSAKVLALCHVSHEKHYDIRRHCVHEDLRAELGIGFILQIPCRQMHSARRTYKQSMTSGTQNNL